MNTAQKVNNTGDVGRFGPSYKIGRDANGEATRKKEFRNNLKKLNPELPYVTANLKYVYDDVHSKLFTVQNDGNKVH